MSAVTTGGEPMAVDAIGPQPVVWVENLVRRFGDVEAVSLTALGLLLASRMQQVESFMAVMNFVMLPMFS